MKYYQGHEQVYQRLEQAGKTQWADRAGGQGVEVECGNLRRSLEELFAHVAFAGPDLDALDLGCGTGPISHELAKRGFATLGLDVSAIAVKIAQRLAAEAGLARAAFATGDIVDYPDRSRRFDLVVDAACLHCIVFDGDRAAALANIRGLLKPEGRFLVNTKTSLGMPDPGPNFVLDETGILWVRTPRRICEQSKEIDGGWLMPQRRALSPDALRAELAAAGFAVDTSWTTGSGLFGAICRRA
ncbi:MAG: class I SAM-dependent methyltransferase [Planctomycetota bacterium]|nr:class I SAM-dependent methyltransferase [Planctomycetota bacterium]